MRSATKSNSWMRNRVFIAILLLSLIVPFKSANAQDTTGPVYIVQLGDSLSSIAARFSVSLNDLMAANGISDPNQLAAGQQLIIPGLEGVTGILNTRYINFGDSYRSMDAQPRRGDEAGRDGGAVTQA